MIKHSSSPRWCVWDGDILLRNAILILIDSADNLAPLSWSSFCSWVRTGLSPGPACARTMCHRYANIRLTRQVRYPQDSLSSAKDTKCMRKYTMLSQESCATRQQTEPENIRRRSLPEHHKFFQVINILVKIGKIIWYFSGRWVFGLQQLLEKRDDCCNTGKITYEKKRKVHNGMIVETIHLAQLV